MMHPFSVDLLLDLASELDTGAIRQLALKVRAAAVDLDKALVFERQRKRADALRRELARIEALPSPGPGRTASGQDRAATVDYDPATVRAWATATDWPGPVPAKGRYLPADLVAAWRESVHLDSP